MTHARTRRGAATRAGPAGLLVGGALVVVVLAVLVAARWAPLVALDHATDAGVHPDVLGSPALLDTAWTFTTIGSPVAVDAVTLVGAVGLVLARRWRAAAVVVVARVGELACETALKHLLARPRPALVPPITTASGFSFPSGHSAGSAAVFGALVLLAVSVLTGAGRRVLLVLAGGLLVAGVAASRVLLGVHYPSDVVGGVALGLAWAGLAVLLARLALPRDDP